MTYRQFYEETLVALRKVKAPNLYVEDFVTLANKAILDSCRVAYKLFETTQEWTDALETLKQDVTLTFRTPTGPTYEGDTNSAAQVSYVANGKYNSEAYRITLPANYWHILGLELTTVNIKSVKCYPKGYVQSNEVKYLTSDQGAKAQENDYLKIKSSRPYYQLRKSATANVQDFTLFTGKAGEVLADKLYLEYLKLPELIALTVEDIERPLELDNTPELEFTRDFCYRIIDAVVTIFMENSGMQRLNTHLPINKPITAQQGLE
jgi:hypothetical protein